MSAKPHTALRFSSVRKSFGKHVALNGLDLDVRAGCLMGLVGPNGAGKTTTFAVASGALEADSGEVDVLGRGVFDPARHAGDVGLVPQDCALPKHSSALQMLQYFARLQGMTRKQASKEAMRWLDTLQLADRAHARVGELSHGMKRRLAVAQALLGDPKLVLLDEPTAGLDPHLVVAMRELLVRERQHRTLVVSSHVLADLERTCDEITFVEAGRRIRAGGLDTIRVPEVIVALAQPFEGELQAILGGREQVLSENELRWTLRKTDDVNEVVPEVVSALSAAGARILGVQVGSSLEDAYMALRGESE